VSGYLDHLTGFCLKFPVISTIDHLSQSTD